jgi:hypothetical protein
MPLTLFWARSDAVKSSAERAAEMVRAETRAVGAGLMFGKLCLRTYGPPFAREVAEEASKQYRAEFTAALDAHAEEAVREALAEGLRGCPVSEDELDTIRLGNTKSTPPWQPERAAYAINKLLVVIKHLKHAVAMLTNDHRNECGPYTAGLEAGRREGAEAENEECARLAEEIAEYNNVGGHKLANAIRARRKGVTP